MSPAPCAVVAARDPALADCMWSTVEVDGEETVDPDARRRARLICRKCPLRASCLTDSIQGGWKDRNLVGGLEYRARVALAQLIAVDLGVSVAGLHGRFPRWRIEAWFRLHPDWPARIEAQMTGQWRRSKRRSRASGALRRPDLPPDLRPMPDPVGGAVQGTLFD